jgi:hypothetical protein
MNVGHVNKRTALSEEAKPVRLCNQAEQPAPMPGMGLALWCHAVTAQAAVEARL